MRVLRRVPQRERAGPHLFADRGARLMAFGTRRLLTMSSLVTCFADFKGASTAFGSPRCH